MDSPRSGWKYLQPFLLRGLFVGCLDLTDLKVDRRLYVALGLLNRLCQSEVITSNVCTYGQSAIMFSCQSYELCLCSMVNFRTQHQPEKKERYSEGENGRWGPPWALMTQVVVPKMSTMFHLAHKKRQGCSWREHEALWKGVSPPVCSAPDCKHFQKLNNPSEPNELLVGELKSWGFPTYAPNPPHWEIQCFAKDSLCGRRGQDCQTWKQQRCGRERRRVLPFLHCLPSDSKSFLAIEAHMFNNTLKATVRSAVVKVTNW